MSNQYRPWAFGPALFLPGIFLAASCGSSPDVAGTPPAPELAQPAEDEVPPAEVLLQEQLEAMSEALAAADVAAEVEHAPEPEPVAEPVVEEPVLEEPVVVDEEEVAEEVAELFYDPNELYPVDLFEGFDTGSDLVFEPVAEEPVEVADADVEPVIEDAVEVADADVEPVLEDAVEVADADVEPVLEDAVEVAATDVEPVLEDAVEVAATDVEPVVEDAVEVAATDVEPVLEDVVEVAAVELEPVIEELLVVDADPAVEVDPAVDPDVIELEVLAGPVADPEGDPEALFAVEPEPEPEPELAQEAVDPVEVPEEPVVPVEETPDFVEQPEAAFDLDPILDAAVAAAEEPGLPDPTTLVWFDPTEVDALTPELVETPDLHAARVAPVSLASLPPQLAFVGDLDPARRALVAPLLLLEPTGSVARMAADGPALFDTTLLGIAPPEFVDPALAHLPGDRRIDGSEFDPQPVEDLLVDDPGLGMIWWGDVVPFDHVDSATRIQTPSVGRVRVVLSSGDYVEGILHAVGDGDYWIDGDLGRFAIEAKKVSHVERMPKPGLGVEIKGLQAGDLVRVKVASGWVEGRLVSMKGEKVLVETAEGMRVTLSGDHVEPLGDSATRVVIP